MTTTMTNETFGVADNQSAFLKLGRKLDHPVTPTQARREFFDWEVEQVGLHDDDFNAVTSHVNNRRTDTQKSVGVVPKGTYGLITNEQFTDLLEATGLLVTAGGVDRGGRQVWMLLDMGESDTLAAVDPHHRYLLAMNSFDGSTNMWTRPLAERLFCRNQFSSLRKARGIPGEVTLRHSKNVEDRLEDARRSLVRAFDAHQAMDDEIRRMLASDNFAVGLAFDRLIEATFGDRPEPEYKTNSKGEMVVSTRRRDNWDRRRDELHGILAGPTCENIAGTDYAAVMAVNEWELNRRARSAATSARRVVAGLERTARASTHVLAAVE